MTTLSFLPFYSLLFHVLPPEGSLQDDHTSPALYSFRPGPGALSTSTSIVYTRPSLITSLFLPNRNFEMEKQQYNMEHGLAPDALGPPLTAEQQVAAPGVEEDKEAGKKQ